MGAAIRVFVKTGDAARLFVLFWRTEYPDLFPDMTSSEIRQSFLDFFRERKHSIVPSSPLMPDSPNLLFTNAGMNQFVPIFLNEIPCPYTPGRAADTQKCIRAGGKHNDLDDVGLDTYHHTFFEMLGNWSFGDYFKREAIDWAWELVVGRWKFPPQRLYATIYQPDPGDPSERDEEAWNFWAEKFRSVGLDPSVHIVNGNKKDNFWMMGETGPCGPCSELHVDLTPAGDTRGALVNKGTAECIEIWNLVFIQFNANADGTFSPLPAQHVDTGMGFERAASIIQGTKGFTDFANAKISNYETDIFRPIFDELEKMSGYRYGSTLPQPNSTGQIIPTSEQEKVDVAFRVIGDHIRTLSFACADGIHPGNTDRNYVLRRILRRAVRYGRSLGFREPFLDKLVAILVRKMGDIFPNVREKQRQIEEMLRREEESFNKTLDRGIELFEYIAGGHEALFETFKIAEERLGKLEGIWASVQCGEKSEQHSELVLLIGEIHNSVSRLKIKHGDFTGDARVIKWQEALAGIGPIISNEVLDLDMPVDEFTRHKARVANLIKVVKSERDWVSRVCFEITAFAAFQLYDTYGFPLDLTELMARERGLTVDTAGFEKLMDEQRARARAAQKKVIIRAKDTALGGYEDTVFVGYDTDSCETELIAMRSESAGEFIVVKECPLYAEMGGQVGDTGTFVFPNQELRVVNTVKDGNVFFLKLESPIDHDALPDKWFGRIQVDVRRRRAIERHHTVTHLLHWALHEVVSHEATQKGSFVGPEKLTFDFNSAALTPAQVRDIERLVNERIVENAPVVWTEVPYAEVKGRPDIMQFFGDKYGETVRVVQIGGSASAFDGYSMELCAGTHARATGEIGLFRIGSEAAIAAGVRRIEAVAGLSAYESALADATRLGVLAGKIGAPLAEVEKKLDALLAGHKELEKALKAANQREAAGRAKDLVSKSETLNGIPAIIATIPDADGDTLQTIADALKAQFQGVIVLGGAANGAVSLVAAVSPDFTAKVQAGKIIGAIAPLVGGKGGGKPDNARGGGKDPSGLEAALAHARTLL